MARVGPDADWQTIYEGEVAQDPRFHLVGFAKGQPNLLYVLAQGDNGRLAARTYDLQTHRLGPVLVEDSACDVAALVHDYQLAGLYVPCRNDQRHDLDADWQHDYETVKTALKAEQVTVVDRSRDGKRTLLAVSQLRTSPLSFWLIDARGDHMLLTRLGGAYDKLPVDQIAPLREVSYRARDGLTIPALLTLPLGYHGGEPIAFVVLPHGGPTAHDNVGFDWMAQFLVSRGYGVLQPQFRGSSGYGTDFQRAGFQQWGRAMQDDVTDGTHWLIDQKFADPERICIVGTSYGGYAALMGAIKEPGLYACSAAFAPVADMDMLVDRVRSGAFHDINLPRIKGDGQSLDPVSPVLHAEQIRVPVLLVHGRKDFVVPVEQSEAMERALKRAGRPVQAIYLDETDHYFSTTADRLAWLTALDQFLAINLAGSGPAQ